MPDPQMKLPPGATLVSDGPAMKLPPGATLVTAPVPQQTLDFRQSLRDMKYQPPDDNAVWHAVKAAGGDLTDAAKSLYHTVTDVPETAGDKTAFALGGGTVGLTLKRMVHGYFNAVQDSIDKAKRAAAEGDMSGVMFHSAAAGLPLVGPLTEGVYDKAKSGDTSGAVGVGASRVAQLMSMAPEKSVIPNPASGLVKTGAAVANKTADAIKPVANDYAKGMYQSALKPPVNNPNAAAMVETGLENRIPISAAGVEKLSTLVDDLNTKIGDAIAKRPGVTINKFKVASRLGDTATEFANQVNPTKDLRAVGDSGNEFLDTQPSQIPADKAQSLKVGTYKQLAGKYGELGNAAIESQKALARGLKDELATAFPELNDINSAEGKLLDLRPALERAVARTGNHQIVGIGTPIVGGAAAVATGSGAIGGVAAIMKAVIDNPGVKGRLAEAIYWGSKKSPTPITMSAAKARVAAYSLALGQNEQK